MKPSFREAADKRLNELTFTDTMKLSVLVRGRRSARPRYLRYAAVACALLLMVSAFALLSIKPHPDRIIIPDLPAGQKFSSPGMDIVVTSSSWDGYYLSIDYTVSSSFSEDTVIALAPFTSSDASLIEMTGGIPAAEETMVCLSPGKAVSRTAKLRIDGCKPGDTVEARLEADLYLSGSAAPSEHVTALVTSVVPADLCTGTLIRSGVNNGNGLFGVKINKGLFTPEKTDFSITITSDQTLKRKGSCRYSVCFIDEDGSLSATYDLSDYQVIREVPYVRNALYKFDIPLEFAPATIKIICEWEGSSCGSAEVVFSTTH